MAQNHDEPFAAFRTGHGRMPGACDHLRMQTALPARRPIVRVFA
jgi:hypothetical protein